MHFNGFGSTTNDDCAMKQESKDYEPQVNKATDSDNYDSANSGDELEAVEYRHSSRTQTENWSSQKNSYCKKSPAIATHYLAYDEAVDVFHLSSDGGGFRGLDIGACRRKQEKENMCHQVESIPEDPCENCEEALNQATTVERERDLHTAGLAEVRS
jgi:hypothetical protein